MSLPRAALDRLDALKASGAIAQFVVTDLDDRPVVRIVPRAGQEAETAKSVVMDSLSGYLAASQIDVEVAS